MERYIDANKTLDELDEFFDTNYWGNTPLIDGVVRIVNNQKPADVAPVIHAHWIETEDLSGNHYAECSNCCLLWWIDGESSQEAEMNYCPRCGARMDEVL